MDDHNQNDLDREGREEMHEEAMERMSDKSSKETWNVTSRFQPRRWTPGDGANIRTQSCGEGGKTRDGRKRNRIKRNRK